MTTPVTTAARRAVDEQQLAALKGHVRGEAADLPGVYRMLSRDGEVIYIGKSKRVRSRLLSYFRCAYPEDKGARILREAGSIDWEYTPSEFAALLHELRLIKRFRPRFNVAMKRDARHFAFIKLTRPPASKLLIVRGPSDDSAIYYGPFHGARQLEESVRELNDVLGLRDCAIDRRMYFADQQELFLLEARTPGCIRYEVRKCLGPCVGACSEQQYVERVAMARAFLDGANDGPIETLRRQMESHSDRLEFERAAALRDKLWRLEALREQFLRFRFAVETLSFLYTVPGVEGDDRVYLIRRGRVRAECPAPRSTRERTRLGRLERDVFGPVERASTQVSTHEIDELLLLSSWFRRFPGELARTKRSGFAGASDGADAPLATRKRSTRRAPTSISVSDPGDAFTRPLTAS
ncbi:MAG TPA: UvrB/UvrC motif-containing protein [Gemmatimonadaceae bacterium]|nr:UvrB/UvrC motif-containing protein [Gemmatimonadaceae bacterium]